MWRHIPRKIGGLSKLSKGIIRNTDGTTTTNTPPPRMGRGAGIKDKKIFEGASDRFRREIEQAKVEVVKEEKRSEIETKRKTAYEKATREGASEADRVEYMTLSKSLDKQKAGEFNERAKSERRKMIKMQSRTPIRKERDDGLEGLSSTELYTRLYGKAPKSTRKFVDHDPEEEKQMKEREKKEAEESAKKYTEDMHKKIEELDTIEPEDFVVEELEKKVFADELNNTQFIQSFEKEEAAKFSNMTFTPEQELEFGGEENAYIHQEQSHFEYEDISHLIDEGGEDEDDKLLTKKKKSKYSLSDDEESDEDAEMDKHIREDRSFEETMEATDATDQSNMDSPGVAPEYDEDGNQIESGYDPNDETDIPPINTIVRNLQRFKSAADGMQDLESLNPIELFHIAQKTPFGYHKFLEHHDSFEANVVGGLPLVIHNEMKEAFVSDLELMKTDCQVYMRHANGSVKAAIRHQKRTRLAKKLKKQNRPPQEPTNFKLHLPQDPFLTIPMREKPQDPAQKRILEQALRNMVLNPCVYRPLKFQFIKGLKEEFEKGESNDPLEKLIRLHKVDMKLSFPGKPKPR